MQYTALQPFSCFRSLTLLNRLRLLVGRSSLTYIFLSVPFNPHLASVIPFNFLIIFITSFLAFWWFSSIRIGSSPFFFSLKLFSILIWFISSFRLFRMFSAIYFVLYFVYLGPVLSPVVLHGALVTHSLFYSSILFHSFSMLSNLYFCSLNDLDIYSS